MDYKLQIRQASEVCEQGDIGAGLAILRDVVHQDPTQKVAWWGIATIASDPDEKRQALKQVLELAPGHKGAQRKLKELLGKQPAAPKASAKKSMPKQKVAHHQVGSPLNLWLVFTVMSFLLVFTLVAGGVAFFFLLGNQPDPITNAPAIIEEPTPAETPMLGALPEPRESPSSEPAEPTPTNTRVLSQFGTPVPSASSGGGDNQAAGQVIGDLIPEENMVEYGSDVNALRQILESISFHPNDAVRVTQGGEALMDFGDKMLLRLFNDTRMKVVSMAATANSPLDVRMFLEEGGFTGQLTAEGGQAVFETPGGAEIIVLGTDFFVIYDSEAGLTTAGNFGGSVEVVGAGTRLTLPSSSYVEIPDNQPPGQSIPLASSLNDFEQRARTLQSPVAATGEMGNWALSITHEGPEFDAEELLGDGGFELEYLATWSGQFRLEGVDIIGNGVGAIHENSGCRYSEDDPLEEFDKDGTFDFEIGGKLVSDQESNPVFQLEIKGSNLNIEITDTPSGCSDEVDPDPTGWLEILTLDPQRMTEPIEVQAKPGATAIINFMEILGLGPFYSLNLSERVPLTVTVTSANVPLTETPEFHVNFGAYNNQYIEGDEYLSEGIRLSTATESTDCDDGDLQVLLNILFALGGLGSGPPCSAPLVTIDFEEPVSQVQLNYASNSLARLRAYDDSGQLLGTAYDQENSEEMVFSSGSLNFNSGSANISRVFLSDEEGLGGGTALGLSSITYRR